MPDCDGSLFIVYRSISELKPRENNARTHSPSQIRLLKRSIQEFGFLNPVMIDAKGFIVAGYGRVQVAKLLGYDRIPTVQIDGLSEDQIRAYILADNQLALKAGWDYDLLAIELGYLLTVDTIDITTTGFEIAEVDVILEEANVVVADDPPEDPAPDQSPITQTGDLWLLRKHRVVCNNSLHQSTYRELLGNRRAATVFTDPPFNVRIYGHATGNGETHHREFEMASGEMSEPEFDAFLDKLMRLATQFSEVNSVHYIFMDWRHIRQLLDAGKENYEELLNICVWAKNNGGMGSFYRSQHELIGVFRKGKGPHRNNVQLGKFGRNRTNVWEYPGIQTLSKQSDEGNLLAMHPTVKPIALVADAILDCTARGEIVLDPFLGSGTTLMAAERVGRVCYAIEIDPIYVDVAIRRWQKYTGEAAVHAVSGKRFDEISAEQGRV